MLDTAPIYCNPLIAATLDAARAACADRTPDNVAAQIAVANPVRAAYRQMLDTLTQREHTERKAQRNAAFTLRDALQANTDAQEIIDAQNTFAAIRDNLTVVRATRDAVAELHYTAHTALIAIICNMPELIVAAPPDAALDADLPVPTTDDLAAAAALHTYTDFAQRYHL